MAATKNAKSVRNDTKEFITTALVELLKKDTLQDITISRLVSRAGVSRMAFYRNFETVQQVLYEYYNLKINSVFENMKNSSNKSDKLNSHLDFFNNFSEELILSHKHGYEPIINEIFTKQVESFYKDSDNNYHITFMAAGAYAVWKKWLLGGTKVPLEDVMQTLSVFHEAMNKHMK
ncbi:MAG: TetR/AcrR family transcriptional regulator [Defluviitaleaceae bacterium]|nr:TetR/AcrR family transcriptional regulator [Defluviitaleaceae bacterium]